MNLFKHVTQTFLWQSHETDILFLTEQTWLVCLFFTDILSLSGQGFMFNSPVRGKISVEKTKSPQLHCSFGNKIFLCDCHTDISVCAAQDMTDRNVCVTLKLNYAKYRSKKYPNSRHAPIFIGFGSTAPDCFCEYR